MKSKARSPTERVSEANQALRTARSAPQTRSLRPRGAQAAVKKATDGRSVMDVVFFALQCSQRIGQWLTLLSVVHIISTQVAVMGCPALAEPLGGILETCVPYYKLGVSAYFGKAAIENVLKITKDLRTATTYSTSVKASELDENG